MARKSKRNASRGSVNNIILETLYSGEKYGYEIIKEVEKKTDGKIVLKQPSLYSSLSRFESKNYVSSYWSDSEIGGKRHYYYLTDEGKKYYEDNVLNKKSEYDFLNDDYVPPVKEELEEDNNNSEEYNYDESENSDYSSSYNFNKYNFDVQDRMNELLGETTLEETTDDIEDYYTESDNVEDSIIEEELFTEDLEENIEDVFENDIEVNQSNTNQYDEEEVLQDKINSIHTAYSVDSETKPVSETIKYTNNLSKEISNVYNSIKSYNDIENKIDETDYIREQKKKDSMEVLYGTDIEENKNTSKYKFTNFSNDYYIDENGITRKRYDSSSTTKPNRNYSNIVMTSKYNSSDYEEILANSTKKKVVEEPQKNLFVEEDLSDEDRELRNKRFTEKFNSIADSRLVTHNEVENDYQEDLSSLHSFYEESENESYNDEENSEKYVEFDEEENYYFPNNSRNPQEEYIEKEDYYESKEQENIKINSYRQKERFETTSQTNYIKINKAKFIFGLALLILMLLEISTFLIVLKNSDTYFTNDQGLFIVAYIITFIVALTFILPFFINPNKRKLNTFRFGYSISIGILSFLVLTTLTYAINTFIGFDITNFNYFIAKLLLPIILAFNFIIGPVIYKIITLNKNLY